MPEGMICGLWIVLPSPSTAFKNPSLFVWFLFQCKSQSEQVLCVKPQANAVLGDNVPARVIDTLRKF